MRRNTSRTAPSSVNRQARNRAAFRSPGDGKGQDKPGLSDDSQNWRGALCSSNEKAGRHGRRRRPRQGRRRRGADRQRRCELAFAAKRIKRESKKKVLREFARAEARRGSPVPHPEQKAVGFRWTKRWRSVRRRKPGRRTDGQEAGHRRQRRTYGRRRRPRKVAEPGTATRPTNPVATKRPSIPTGQPGSEKGAGSTSQTGSSASGGQPSKAGSSQGETADNMQRHRVQQSPGGAGERQGTGGTPGTADAAGDTPPPAARDQRADDPNLEYARKATDLALERLKHQLDKNQVDQKLLPGSL